MFKLLIVLTLLTVNVYPSSLPDYIERCRVKDPNANKCFVRNSNKAIPHLLKGDKNLNIPNLLPLRISHAEQQNGNLKLSLDNITCNGIDTFEVTDVKLNIEKNEVIFYAKLKYFEVDGTYNVNGQILILPISGHGSFNCNLNDVTFVIDFNWDTYEKNGATHMKLVKYNFEYHADKVHFNLENLFNGDKALGDEMNKFLNENAKDVLKELGTPLIETIKLISENAFNYTLSENSLGEIFIL